MIAPLFGDQSSSRALVWIVLLSFFTHLLAILLTLGWQQPPSDKSQKYDPIALSLIDGEGFSLNGRPTAISAPGYPLFLAVTYGVVGYRATTAVPRATGS